MLAGALVIGMRLKVLPGDPPIEVKRVTETTRGGQLAWEIEGLPVRVPIHGGGCQQVVRYVVPDSYLARVEMVA
jgi:hypothetical protein